MSEKRHRQQQRRQRRKAAARPRPNGAASRGGSMPTRRDADRELGDLMKSMAAIVVREAHESRSALEAEQWASAIVGTWHARPLYGSESIEDLFFPGFVTALEALGTAPALATLRALSAIGAGIHGKRARAAADRLAAAGLPEPAWCGELGEPRLVASALMFESAFDDGVNVFLEFADTRDERHTVGVYIDHNLGGLVKDAFVAGPLNQVRDQLLREGAQFGLRIEDLDPAEARARVEVAFDVLDHTFEPPVHDDVRPLRALIEARMRLLPQGASLPDGHEEFTQTQREQLLADFLDSPEGQRWRGDEDAEDVVMMAIDFGADYNHGGPLRWSGVVVEIFMTSWLARKVAHEPQFFQRVADVLPDWVTYVGHLRGVPEGPLRDAAAAVGLYRDQMLEVTGDEEAWGPAKVFAVAAQQAGVDLTDPEAVARFIEQYNSGLAA